MKYLSIFFLGSLVGYIYEVIFYFLMENRLDNAGLLFGPWLPIYGIGALLITFMSKYLKNKPLICFFSKLEPNFLSAIVTCLMATMSAGGVADLVKIIKKPASESDAG